ncbi:MAG: dephospho-CoA kinase [Sphingobacteriia bacterium]|nr:dephospho-CoA kinase [Sphingobacteriia bacterium]
MLKIGLTGGIGSGKSIVSKIFETLGIPVFDADTAAKMVMEEDETLKQQLKAAFGEAVYENNKLNRKYLAGIVFTDKDELNKLNALVHPAAIEMGLQWAAKQQSPYIVKEAALMFEAGSAFNLDYVIGVSAPRHLRILRTMQRDHISREEVMARMNKQIDEEVKMKLCDFVVLNDEQELLLPQVLSLHKKFLEMAKHTL